MSVAYVLPQPSWSVDDRVETEVLREGPAYIRGRRSTRWHRVRSSTLSLRSWEPDRIRQTWEFWCGPHTHEGYGRPWLTDEPPDGEPLCGTCEGRWRGTQDGHRWLFSPRPGTPPKVCPGSQRRELASPDSSAFAGKCLVCQEYVKMRGFGGPYAGGWGPQRHAPGPGLIEPCEVHGWNRLERRNGVRVVCACRGVAKVGM